MNNRLQDSAISSYGWRSAFLPCRNWQLAKVRHLLASLAVIVAGFSGADRVQAQIYFSTSWSLPAPTTGNFTDNANWNNGSPDDLVSWAIDNGGTAQISSVVNSQEGYLGFSSGQSGTLQILNGGTISSGLGGGFEDIVVGRNGTGLLEIESGGSAIVQTLFVAGEAGSAGTVNVNGGLLDVRLTLHVGDRGIGQFTLTGNGTVQSETADIGRVAGSSGTASITDGQWSNTDAIFVGLDGNGTLDVNAQGRITSKSVYIGQNATASGTTAVSGGNITLSDTLAVGVNGTGNLTVSAGGDVSAKFVQVGLESGSVGTASLSGNASVTATQFVQVGVNPGSTGTVTLSGNATLDTPSLVVGTFGTATFNMTAGTSLNAENIGVAEISGTGVLNVNGGTVTTAAIVGGGSGATVNLFDGTTLRPTNSNGIIITGFSPGGFNLTGNVTIDTSAFSTSQIQSQMSGTGTFIKAGTGAVALTVANTYSGGTVIQGGTVGVGANNAFGTGNIVIGNAQILSSSNSTIGSEIPLIQVGANQTATFSATAGSTFTVAPISILLGNGGTFRAGSSGNNGTVVFSPDLASPLQSGTGGVTVAFGTLQAGNSQLASLTAQAGTTTVDSGAILDFQDHLSGGSIRNLQGAGTVQIGSNSTSMLAVNGGSFSGNIAGAGGLVKSSSDTLILSGNNTFTGGTSINAGTLLVNGSLDGFGAVSVNVGGTLGGNGTVGAISLNGGTLSPGNSPGTLIAADLLWYDGSILFELGATPATSDLIQTGTLQGLGGPGTNYEFTFVDQGMTPNFTYDLITFSGPPLIDKNAFKFTNGGGFGGTFDYSGSTLQFTVIPEPSTWALMFLATILFAVRGMRGKRTGPR